MTTHELFGKTDQEICGYAPETSATALGILKSHGFSENDRFKAVADVFRSGTVAPPPCFPRSKGCVQWGIAIARHILNTPDGQPVINWTTACELGIAEFISGEHEL
jgi:hypothetical protein